MERLLWGVTMEVRVDPLNVFLEKLRGRQLGLAVNRMGFGSNSISTIHWLC